jgi:hypothetical protein
MREPGFCDRAAHNAPDPGRGGGYAAARTATGSHRAIRQDPADCCEPSGLAGASPALRPVGPGIAGRADGIEAGLTAEAPAGS